MPRGNKLKSGVRSKTGHRTLEQSRTTDAKYQATKKQRKNRELRNKHRKAAGLKVGDPREFHHTPALSAGGKGSGRVTTRKANRTAGNKTRKA